LLPGRFTGLHRARFHSVLLKRLGATCTTHTSKRLLTYIQPAGSDSLVPIQLAFADGSSATCDVLFGADGVKSAVRGEMFEELAAAAERTQDAEAALKWRTFVRPTFSGCIALRVVVPSWKLEKQAPGHPALSGTVVVSSLACMVEGKLKLFRSSWAKITLDITYLTVELS
jgi:salicylate hydroxylase